MLAVMQPICCIFTGQQAQQNGSSLKKSTQHDRKISSMRSFQGACDLELHMNVLQPDGMPHSVPAWAKKLVFAHSIVVSYECVHIKKPSLPEFLAVLALGELSGLAGLANSGLLKRRSGAHYTSAKSQSIRRLGRQACGNHATSADGG